MGGSSCRRTESRGKGKGVGWTCYTTGKLDTGRSIVSGRLGNTIGVNAAGSDRLTVGGNFVINSPTVVGLSASSPELRNGIARIGI